MWNIFAIIYPTHKAIGYIAVGNNIIWWKLETPIAEIGNDGLDILTGSHSRRMFNDVLSKFYSNIAIPGASSSDVDNISIIIM